jgi:SutA RNAP-binding domain
MIALRRYAMKPIKTKAQIRAEIDSQIDSFISKGGAVNEFDRGLSGRLVNDPLPKAPHIESPASQTRTPVLSEIQAIEARKHPVKPSKPPRRRNQDRKVLLMDDFGEPLRWVSED